MEGEIVRAYASQGVLGITCVVLLVGLVHLYRRRDEDRATCAAERKARELEVAAERKVAADELAAERRARLEDAQKYCVLALALKDEASAAFNKLFQDGVRPESRRGR